VGKENGEGGKGGRKIKRDCGNYDIFVRPKREFKNGLKKNGNTCL